MGLHGITWLTFRENVVKSGKLSEAFSLDRIAGLGRFQCFTDIRTIRFVVFVHKPVHDFFNIPTVFSIFVECLKFHLAVKPDNPF